MTRTAIMLPEKLKGQAEKLAQAKGISLGELIRVSLEKNLQNETPDPFFSDRDIFTGSTPSDLSSNPDHYLYE